jgi:hypothetical protein
MGEVNDEALQAEFEQHEALWTGGERDITIVFVLQLTNRNYAPVFLLAERLFS